MTQFVFITDLHLANKPPENRIDNYNDSIFSKLNWVLAYCNRHKVKRLIIGGDLAHSYKPDDELIYRFVQKIKSAGVEVYFIYGNHDIQGGNKKYVNRTNFGLLSQHPWFHLLDANLVKINGVVVAGYDYVAKDECRHDWPFPKTDVPDAIRILVVHAMIVNEQSIMKDGKYRQVNLNDITTNADVLLCGHYHFGFPKAMRVDILNKTHILVNPGSIGRIDAFQASKTFGPRLAHIIVKNGKVRVRLVSIPCKPIDEVFDLKALKQQKDSSAEKINFIAAMQDLLDSKVMGCNFVEQLSTVLKEPPPALKRAVSPAVIKLCRRKVEQYT